MEKTKHDLGKRPGRKRAYLLHWLYNYLLVVCLAAFNLTFTLYAHAEAEPGSSTAPVTAPTSACPSLDEENYFVKELDDQVLSSEKAKDNKQLANELIALISKIPQDKKNQSTINIITLFANQLKPKPMPEFLIGQSKMLFVVPENEKATASPEIAGKASWITALTQVIAYRAEAELQLWLQEDVMNHICYKESQNYFPNLCALYRPYQEDIIVTALPSEEAIVKALRKDLETLPACIIRKVNKEQKGGDWGYVLSNEIKLVKSGGGRPVMLLAGLSENEYVKKHCNYANDNLCAAYFSSVLMHTYLASHKTSVPPVNVYELLGRVYIKLKEDEKWDLMNELSEDIYSDKIEKTNDRIKTIISKLRIIEKIVNDMKTQMQELENVKKLPDRKDRELELTFGIADNFIQLLGITFETVLNKQADQLKRTQTIVRISALLQSGRYQEAMPELSKVAFCLTRKDKQIPKGFTDDCGPWKALRDSLLKKEHKNALKAVEVAGRYLPIITEMSNAKTTQEMKTVLDEAASPIGSWKLKRQSSLISIGALVGINGGYERLNGRGVSPQRSGFEGVFAPVGVDFSTPMGTSTIGAFLSIINVGNLMSIRSSDGGLIKVKDEPNTKFNQVFSPGIFVRFGLGKTPWVFGIGAEWTQGLRDAEISNGTTVPLNSCRYSAFLAMDIPLFPIW